MGGYEVAMEEFRFVAVTERELDLGNVDANPGITIERNAALIEPGLEIGNPPPSAEALSHAEVKGALDCYRQEATARAHGSRSLWS